MAEDDFKVSAYPKVTVTIEVTSLGSYGPKCTVDQILRQGAREGEQAVRSLIQGHRGMRIVGTPVVEVVTIKTKE